MEFVRYFLKAVFISALFAAGSLPVDSILRSFNSATPAHTGHQVWLVSSNQYPAAPVQQPDEDKPVIVQRISQSVQVLHVRLVQPVIFLFRITRHIEQAPDIPELFAWISPPELRKLFRHTISRQAP